MYVVNSAGISEIESGMMKNSFIFCSAVLLMGAKRTQEIIIAVNMLKKKKM